MKLTVQNAEIKTATVEVKTLTISGKQVTLAVFRQLREAPLLDSDGTLYGTPWGTVNYHPDKCGDEPIHLHVVWQFGTDLQRSKVLNPANFFKPLTVSGASDFAQQLYCQNGHRLTHGMTRHTGSAFTLGDVRVAVGPSGLINHYEGDRCARYAQDATHASGAVHAAVREAKQRRAPYFDRWTELNNLPQLFIAV